MKEQNFQIGRLVRSRAGRDAGRYFVITGFPEENYAYISDGAVRKLNAPKKKKLKHLELCPQDVQACLLYTSSYIGRKRARRA